MLERLRGVIERLRVTMERLRVMLEGDPDSWVSRPFPVSTERAVLCVASSAQHQLGSREERVCNVPI